MEDKKLISKIIARLLGLLIGMLGMITGICLIPNEVATVKVFTAGGFWLTIITFAVFGYSALSLLRLLRTRDKKEVRKCQ